MPINKQNCNDCVDFAEAAVNDSRKDV